MATSPPSLDIVSVAIVALTAVFGVNAAVVGPYAVIFLAAIGGAAWSASNRPPDKRMPTLLHIALMVGLALITTVPIAELVGRWLSLDSRWMFAPIAVVISSRPEWVVATFKKLIERRIDAVASSADVPPTPPTTPPEEKQ